MMKNILYVVLASIFLVGSGCGKQETSGEGRKYKIAAVLPPGDYELRSEMSIKQEVKVENQKLDISQKIIMDAALLFKDAAQTGKGVYEVTRMTIDTNGVKFDSNLPKKKPAVTQMDQIQNFIWELGHAKFDLEFDKNCVMTNVDDSEYQKKVNASPASIRGMVQSLSGSMGEQIKDEVNNITALLPKNEVGVNARYKCSLTKLTAPLGRITFNFECDVTNIEHKGDKTYIHVAFEGESEDGKGQKSVINGQSVEIGNVTQKVEGTAVAEISSGYFDSIDWHQKTDMVMIISGMQSKSSITLDLKNTMKKTEKEKTLSEE
jgi:hypothetical protein